MRRRIVATITAALILFTVSPTDADQQPQISGLRPVYDVATCSQLMTIGLEPYAAYQCQRRFASGLELFSFRCDNCNVEDQWAGRFVINGIIGNAGDLALSRSLNYAWTQRANEVVPSDCVSVSLTDYSGQQPPPVFQSNTVCIKGSTRYHRSGVFSNSGTGNAGSVAPSAPTGLQFTRDRYACADHARNAPHYIASICTENPSGAVLKTYLVWNSTCVDCDGFAVYRVSGSGLSLYARHSLPASVVRLPDFTSGCYTVKVVRGSIYSSAAAPVCGPP